MEKFSQQAYPFDLSIMLVVGYFSCWYQGMPRNYTITDMDLKVLNPSSIVTNIADHSCIVATYSD